MPSKDEDGLLLEDEKATAAFIARFWAVKVAATEREALRPEPEDLSPTQEEVNAACSDMPQHEEIIASLTQLSKDKACGWDMVSARLLNLEEVKQELVLLVQQVWAEETLPAEIGHAVGGPNGAAGATKRVRV